MFDHISIHQARERNLHIDEIKIPLGQLVLFAGPSGSGKSSLGIDTILAEGQRRCFEALQSSFPIASLSPNRPNVGTIQNLPPCFGMKQDISLPFSKTSSIADILGIQPLLEQLFLQHGILYCPKSQEPLPYYSTQEATQYLLKQFPNQACTLLHQLEYTPENYSSLLKGLHQNGVARLCYPENGKMKTILLEDAPKSSPKQLFMVLDRIKLRESNSDRCQEAITKGYQSNTKQIFALIGQELHSFSKAPYSAILDTFFPEPSREYLQASSSLGACPDCQGEGESSEQNCSSCHQTGLAEYASLLRIQNQSFSSLLQLPIAHFSQWIRNIHCSEFIEQEISRKIELLIQLNIDLPLRRRMRTLSTGERSRIRLSAILSQQLGDALYIIDEPSLGLSSSEVLLVIESLKKQIQSGQSFIVIDHHPLFLQHSETIFHFGPGSGKHGGQIVESKDLTQNIDSDPKIFSEKIAVSSPKWEVFKGGINIISGHSGVGKTQLLERLYTELSPSFLQTHHLNKLAVNANKRSCVATICDLWTPIRSVLAETKQAKIHGFSSSMFSFNRKGGRCESCHGLGFILLELPPLPPSDILCPECHGKRFHSLVLDVSYRSQNAHQILESTIEEALKIFEFHPLLSKRLRALNMIGLGYLQLGQPTPSLSGGEHRRIQLAKILEPCLEREANLKEMLLLLDDPTAALHPSDAFLLQSCFLELRQAGVSLIMTSQNQQMFHIADTILALK